MINNTLTYSSVEVARTILQAITSENPHLRYTVGNDAAKIMQAKRVMSDEEFGNILRQQVLRIPCHTSKIFFICQYY